MIPALVVENVQVIEQTRFALLAAKPSGRFYVIHRERAEFFATSSASKCRLVVSKHLLCLINDTGCIIAQEAYLSTGLSHCRESILDF